MLYIYGTCVGILVCLILCSFCICSYWLCCKPKVYIDPNNPERRLSRRPSRRATSLRATVWRSMRLESIVDASGERFTRKQSVREKRENEKNRNTKEYLDSKRPEYTPKIVRFSKEDYLSPRENILSTEGNIFEKNRNSHNPNVEVGIISNHPDE